MKAILLFLMTLPLTTLAQPEDGPEEIQQQLEASQVHVVRLPEATINELTTAMFKAGGSETLQQDYTRWKMAYRAAITVRTQSLGGTSQKPIVIVGFSNDSVMLSEAAARDIAEVAINFNRVYNPNQSQEQSFNLGMSCLAYGGQGLHPIQFCGFNIQNVNGPNNAIPILSKSRALYDSTCIVRTSDTPYTFRFSSDEKSATVQYLNGRGAVIVQNLVVKRSHQDKKTYVDLQFESFRYEVQKLADGNRIITNYLSDMQSFSEICK